LLFAEALPCLFSSSFAAFDLDILPSFLIAAGSGSYSDFKGFLCFLEAVLTKI
jgi:hypothetical protein